MSNRKYFGTDGIRGRVGDAPITPDFVLKLGWAAGKVLARHGSRKIIIGKDTRISGYMLESALEAGLAAAGLSALFTGPMPTPAVAYLTRTFRAEAGIVISASHNPFYDNGIKFFSIDGTKLPDAVEEAIEAEMEKEISCVDSAELGKASRIVDAAGRYIEFCKATFPNELSLSELKIVVDCANGATYHIAPNVLRELGANVIAIGCEPNGVNINKDCGSTHMETLQKMVVEMGADCGIANDGDADRCLFVDEQGDVMDGDHLMVINALRMKKEGRLNANMVVGTVMSNLGFGKALAEHGCRTVATNVGDRYVLEEMKAHGYSLGGEQSGHIIFPEFNTTGDGLITAMQTLMVLRDHDGPLSELNHLMTTYPQLLKNVKVYSKNGWEENEQIRAAIAAAKDELGNDGRILVRASGTEPLIRVMGEGSDKDRLERVIDDIVSVVEQELGEE